MNFFGNQLTKKFKWQFVFNGSTYRGERQQRFDNIMKLADKGLVFDSSVYASLIGMNPVVFEKSLMASKNSGWLDKYSQLMLNTNTSRSGDNVGGRPEKDRLDKSDSAELNDDQ